LEDGTETDSAHQSSNQAHMDSITNYASDPHTLSISQEPQNYPNEELEAIQEEEEIIEEIKSMWQKEEEYFSFDTDVGRMLNLLHQAEEDKRNLASWQKP